MAIRLVKSGFGSLIQRNAMQKNQRFVKRADGMQKSSVLHLFRRRSRSRKFFFRSDDRREQSKSDFRRAEFPRKAGERHAQIPRYFRSVHRLQKREALAEFPLAKQVFKL